MPQHYKTVSPKTCENCQKLFYRKPHHFSLTVWNKKRFCSKPCTIEFFKKNSAGLFPSFKVRQTYWTKERRQQARSLMKNNKFALGHKLTKEHKAKLVKHNEKHWAWKGGQASYSAIHKWLVKNYGSANKCENPQCKQKSKSFHYALLFGKKYVHIRENYKMLCVSCHKIYDAYHSYSKYKDFITDI